MNAAHLHLLINHFPIASLLFGFLILAVSRVQKSEATLQVALGLLVAGGLAGTAAYLSGDEAYDLLKSVPTFPEAFFKEHAQAAVFGLWATIITGVIAAGGFYFLKKKGAIPKGYLIFLFVVNFWALTVVARVNYLGGLISHVEIRPEIHPDQK